MIDHLVEVLGAAGGAQDGAAALVGVLHQPRLQHYRIRRPFRGQAGEAVAEAEDTMDAVTNLVQPG